MTETTEAMESEKDRNDHENARDNQQVVWRGCDECGLGPPVDDPIRAGEVYELVSVMLRHAPFDRTALTAECIVEVTSQRAWPDFIHLATQIEDAVYLGLDRGLS